MSKLHLGKGVERMIKAVDIVDVCKSQLDIVQAVAGLIENTVFYDDATKTEKELDLFETKIYLIEGDSVDGVFFADEYLKDTGREPILVNYANYTHPGGGFLRGAYAQEEFLCHHSLLYPVLDGFNNSWYANHRRDTNGMLFRNEAMITSNMPFARDFNTLTKGNIVPDFYGEEELNEDVALATVLTIAAPINMYNDTPEKKRMNKEAFIKRIEFMFKVAADASAGFSQDMLITGPFGCGAFKQNPKLCSSVMRRLIDTTYRGTFECVVFAIPDRNSDNYKAFKEAFPEAIEIKA